MEYPEIIEILNGVFPDKCVGDAPCYRVSVKTARAAGAVVNGTLTLENALLEMREEANSETFANCKGLQQVEDAGCFGSDVECGVLYGVAVN